MSHADRPSFILAFAADVQGCAYHRMMMPLASLSDAGLADGRIDSSLWPVELGVAARPDVVVWQRQVEDDHIANLKIWREALPHALFVYELDDYLGDIPEASFHASFMPPKIEKNITRAMEYCNRVSTTTESLAEWFRGLGASDVRVVPNGVPQQWLHEREPRKSGKLRIGFAGGMSHDGDLELLRHAMETIGEEVTWVFFGGVLKNPPCRIEFHPGLPVTLYMQKMMQLDCDLMLAPLETNPFNRAKSNLRLVETGAIGAAIIAQDALPYYLDDPPVFAYAKTPEDWTAAIQAFIKARPAQRGHSADALRSWVGRKYTLERLLLRRADAWLPSTPRWRPAPAQASGERPIMATMDPLDVSERMPFLARLPKVSEGLEIACRRAVTIGTDVLWMRPASVMSEHGWGTLRQVAGLSNDIASIVPLASDGPNGFPLVDRWMPMTIDTALEVDRLVQDHLKGRQLLIPMPSGPVVLLTRYALAMLGLPDVAGSDGNEEQAIIEWGLRAARHNWKHMQAADAFCASIAQPMQPTQQAHMRLQMRGYVNELKAGEALTIEERETLEAMMVKTIWKGPQPGNFGFKGDYESWAILRDVQLMKDAPRIDDLLAYTPFDILDFPSHVEWVIFEDWRLTLRPYAFAYLSQAIVNADSDVDVIYADHESLLPDGRKAPEFKPEFDFELFLAQDYVTSLCAVRIAALTCVPTDVFDLFRQILDIARKKGSKGIKRVPHVLGQLVCDSKPERIALDVLAREMAVRDVFGPAVHAEAHKIIMGCLSVTHVPVIKPLVSIVIPTLGRGRLIQPCVATILQHTEYENFEVLIVQNGERQEPELDFKTRADQRVRVIYYDGTSRDGFNWSKINNWAICNHARGELILTMNDDCNVCVKTWLDNMVGQVVQHGVGAVGARLLHPAGMIQHCGVVCHNGIAGHMHKGLPNGVGGYLGRAFLTHEARAVTGACMLFKRSDFDVIGGFDESFSHNYGDTIFCISLHYAGLRNVVEMSAELLHAEAATRESSTTPVGYKKLIEEGRRLSTLCNNQDPYWSPNLAIGIAQNGLGIQGLNGESLSWTDFSFEKIEERVLVINDLPGMSGGIVCGLLRQSRVPYLADLSGFQLKVVAPSVLNIRPWDVRQPEKIADSLKLIGIDRIIVRSLVGATGAAPPVEVLRAFSEIARSIPVFLEPHNNALMAPFGDAEALIQAKSVFGWVDINAWQEAYTYLQSRECAL